MNRWTIIVAILALLGCSNPMDNSQHEDVFERIADVVYKAAKSPRETRSKWFIPELDAASFPIGLESVWRDPRLIRLRRIDDRMVGDFTVSGNGQFIITIWCEKQALDWMIAGWEPSLRPIVDMDHDRSRLSTMPKRFSAPILRDSPPARRITIARRAARPLGSADRQTPNQIIADVRALDFSKGCKQSRLKRWLTRSELFKNCHREFGLSNQDTGRLLFSVDTSPPTPRITLDESMFRHSGPRDCIMQRMKALRPLKRGCQFSLRLVYRSP